MAYNYRLYNEELMVNSTSACDAVLDIKHGGWGGGGMFTGTKTAFTLAKSFT